MKDVLKSRKLGGLLLFAIVWLVVLTVVELVIFRETPTHEKSIQDASTLRPSPDFNLKNVVFKCASDQGFATAVNVVGASDVRAICETALTPQTTRCPSSFPLSGFAGLIKCAEGESIHCHDGPLQTLGLFQDDSFCGDITDRDMGPPEAAPRVNN